MPRHVIKHYLPRRQCKVLIRKSGLVNNVRKQALDHYRKQVFPQMIAKLLDSAIAIMDNDGRKTVTVRDLERALSLLRRENAILH